MALILMNHSAPRVMILGRWKSTAFMEYIRSQILELSSGLAVDMVAFDHFTEICPRRTDPTNAKVKSHRFVPKFHID